MTKDNNAVTSGVSKNTQPKPYSRPRLADFGTIARLTQQFGNGPASDSGNNMMGAS